MADETDRHFDVQEKIRKYEEFLDQRLAKDLEAVFKSQDEIVAKITEYTQLKSSIEQIQKTDLKGKDLRSRVDLGCNFFCQASVPDPSRIFIAVGYGFFVEFTLSEALNFIEKKLAHLQHSVDKLGKDAAKIKAHMKLVLGGLQELQGLNQLSHRMHYPV
ncbi:predicted protein [Nematostella vectensis]|uniref:Protein UXT homolog n=1 Tax=Nematostella vectensis TaxID=45351 RepID=UXT_NEMVE|nr:RecName: Full=Protein UXT homolog [Nematostella vectensis]EDO30400.1 predicted protein [Nematostella vectensis]|eukprot:XP_001622500.1 predicted protein [Nematostella vectensis]